MTATLFDGMTAEYIKSQAAHKAQELRVQHQIGLHMPVDLNYITQHAGITVSRKDIGRNTDALVTVNKKSFSIDINKRCHLVRYRWGFAQSLGYILAHYPELGIQEGTRYEKWSAFIPENTAEYNNSVAGIHGRAFANEILMPKLLIDTMVEESGSLLNISSSLGLPVDTVSARLHALGHTPLSL